MTSVRWLAFSLLGASALLACGSTGSHSASGASGTSGFGASGPAGSSATGSGGSSASGSGGGALGGAGGSDGGLFNDLDATSDAPSACMHLNIGIFGNPGSDPSSNFQQWLVMSGTSVQRIQTTPTEPVTAATVQPFDVIILDWLTRDYTPAEASTFATWVTAGGGVASMSGYSNNTTNDWHANSLLAPLEVCEPGLVAAHESPQAVELRVVALAHEIPLQDVRGGLLDQGGREQVAERRKLVHPGPHLLGHRPEGPQRRPDPGNPKQRVADAAELAGIAEPVLEAAQDPGYVPGPGERRVELRQP